MNEVTEAPKVTTVVDPMKAALTAMNEAESPKEEKKEEVVEPPKEEPKEAPKEEKKEDLSASKFAAIAKKEKEHYRRDQELKSKERAIAEREERLLKLEREMEEIRQDPDRLLAKNGWDYEKLTQRKLNNDRPTAEMLAEQAIEETKRVRQELSKRDEEAKKKEIDAQQQTVNQQIQAFQSRIIEVCNKNPDKYELINLTGSHQAIYDGIVQKYNEEGEVATIEDAADAIEKKLEDKVEELRTKSKKVQAKWFPKVETPKEEPKAQTKTLTNSNVSPATTLSPATEKERWERAMAALDL